MWRHWKKTVFYKPRTEASEGTSSDGTGISDFQSQGLWEIKFLLFKPFSLWHFAMAAQENYYILTTTKHNPHTTATRIRKLTQTHYHRLILRTPSVLPVVPILLVIMKWSRITCCIWLSCFFSCSLVQFLRVFIFLTFMSLILLNITGQLFSRISLNLDMSNVMHLWQERHTSGGVSSLPPSICPIADTEATWWR